MWNFLKKISIVLPFEVTKDSDYQLLFNFDENADNDEQLQEIRRSSRVRNVPERPSTIRGELWQHEELDCANIAVQDSEEPKSLQEALTVTVNMNH